jgi:hypothetical protein
MTMAMGMAMAREEQEEEFDPYDIEEILGERGVDVWHWNDPLINPNQKESWEDEQRRTSLAVFHLSERRAVQLGNNELRVSVPDNPRVAGASDPTPYMKERTWAGSFSDGYVVSLEDGSAQLLAERMTGGSSAARGWTGRREVGQSASPEGRFLVYYHDEDWHLYDTESGATRNLTAGLPVSFADEDHDYPSARSASGRSSSTTSTTSGSSPPAAVSRLSSPAARGGRPARSTACCASTRDRRASRAIRPSTSPRSMRT